MTNNLLKNFIAVLAIIIMVGVSGAWAEEFKSKLPKCEGEYSSSWNNCYGKQNFINGSYEGEFKNALHDGSGIFKLDTGEQYIGGFKDMLKHGFGEYILSNGDKFIGEFKTNQLVKGIAYYSDGTKQEGIWKNYKFIRAEKVYISELKNHLNLTGNEENKTSGFVKKIQNINDENIETFLIKPEFKDAGDFNEGLARVQSGDKWGFVNKKGLFEIAPKFEWANDFNEGLAAVQSGDKWGFINKKGLFEITPKFKDVENFHEGLAAVQIGGKWGYVNKKGVLVINPQFEIVDSFFDGVARVHEGDFKTGKWGYIDKQGLFIIKPQFIRAGNFSEGIASVAIVNNKTEKWGYIDKQGVFIIKPQFIKARDFSDGLASVAVGNNKTEKWGVIDKKGLFEIKPQFDYVGDFKEGFARVEILDDKAGKSGYFNKQGVLVIKSGKWGYIDKQGVFVIKPQFDFVGDFKDGFATVQVGHYKTGKWGFINKKGLFEITPQFDSVDEFIEGLARVRIGDDVTGKWGFIEKFSNASLNLLKQQQNDIGGKHSKLSLQVTNSQVTAEGDFVINIKTSADTASLKINDEEFGGRADGNYTIKKIARAGQETQFTIVAKDTNGYIDSKTITVSRQVTSSDQVKYAELNPATIKTQTNKDAVAIIIGIADYKNLPKADYANDDARIFYDYALRGLGVKAENIKLLVDGDADQIDIYKAFKTWLPSRVKSTTDVYVYYSGHGLPTADGLGLYLLPQRTDRDFIDKTAINQQEINSALQALKPKSVTIFLDSCYSGMARTGQTLLASARPITLKANTQAFPSEFTVITASQADQISSSSPELKHGIFSYYLMKGMEGDADANKDGKITVGEMHGYLAENVARQASLNNRVQQPQLSGDANRVLVGR